MRELNIVLFGMSIFSENKGCMALAYSFIDLLSESLRGNKANVAIFTNFSKEDLNSFNSLWDNLSITFHEISFRRRNVRNEMHSILSCADICFDSTEGDSFSDIYGLKRLFIGTILKLTAIKRTMLVLTPQTYGPYKSLFAKKLSKKVFNLSKEIYSRDESSAELLKNLFNIEPKISTDTAFVLTPINVNFTRKQGINVGINISGLLYNGGYTGNNQFGLSVDYKIYIDELLKFLSEDKKYNCYLIPHVICHTYDYCENDLKVCEALGKKYSCEVVKDFCLAGELKYVISQMDVFTGARMHSTIAGFSSGVPTIPFSYSKKFEGLYNSLDYPFIVDGKKLSTNEAVYKTIDLIEKYKELKEYVDISLKIANEKLDVFRKDLKEILDNMFKL